jgi:hypothetical protein
LVRASFVAPCTFTPHRLAARSLAVRSILSGRVLSMSIPV